MDDKLKRAIGAMFLARTGRLADSEAAYRALLAEYPDDVELLKCRAGVLQQLWQLDQSLACIRRAVEIKPDDGAAWCIMAVAYAAMGRHEDVGAALRQARAVAPLMPRAEWLYGHWLLKDGQFEAAWEAHEWGYTAGTLEQRTRQREWDGKEDIRGKTLLVWTVGQGMGDIMQSLQLLPLLRERSEAGRVLLEVPGLMVSLAEGQTCADLVYRGSPDGHLPHAFDAHVPLIRVPAVLKLSERDLPGLPFLSADPRLAEQWAKRLPPGFRVGYCCAGNPSHENDRARSIPAPVFNHLVGSDIPGVRFVNLLPRETYDYPNGWNDTMALVANLDIIVTVDSSIMHLAAAMGKPVFMLHSLSGDVRWKKEGETSAWYPSLRIIRQTKYMEWGDVLDRVREELRGLAGVCAER